MLQVPYAYEIVIPNDIIPVCPWLRSLTVRLWEI